MQYDTVSGVATGVVFVNTHVLYTKYSVADPGFDLTGGVDLVNEGGGSRGRKIIGYVDG